MKQIYIEIANDFKKIIDIISKDPISINKKSGEDLSNSNLIKNLQIKVKENDNVMFDIIFDYYITYINNGRRKGAKMPPIYPIVKWAKRKGISTDNSTIYLIRRSISENGIKARPIIDMMFDNIERGFDDKYFNVIFNEIIKDLEKYFNQ